MENKNVRILPAPQFVSELTSEPKKEIPELQPPQEVSKLQEGVRKMVPRLIQGGNREETKQPVVTSAAIPKVVVKEKEIKNIPEIKPVSAEKKTDKKKINKYNKGQEVTILIYTSEGPMKCSAKIVDIKGGFYNVEILDGDLRGQKRDIAIQIADRLTLEEEIKKARKKAA